jgi:putative photosynthetic complex assembly protein 2
MTLVLIAIAFAVFVWWFSTGAVIYLDNLPRHTFKWTMLGASSLAGLAFVGLAYSANDQSYAGIFIAFTSALVAWAWIEVSFYTGFVTGLKRPACRPDCSGWTHLGHAIETSLYHELAIIIFGAAAYMLTRDGANLFGLWTFVVLWWMHQSAKVNVLLGVPNLSEEFLPEHLSFIRSFMRKKPMNLLFPVSVTASTLVAAGLIQAGFDPATSDTDSLGYALLATIMILAILEHWFLVLPLPSAFLWDWSLSSRKARPKFNVEMAVGYLGAGKTTLLNHLLAQAEGTGRAEGMGRAEGAGRTVVLVNDFSSLGLDGSLLNGRGADVIELANGCICCSLSQDLARQLQQIASRFSPARVLIEPSGIADVADLLAVLQRADIGRMIGAIRIFAIFDGARFLTDYARMPDMFEAQARLGSVLVVNKMDLVSAGQLRTIQASLHSFNPRAEIVTTCFGAVSARTLQACTPITAQITDVTSLAGRANPLVAGLTSWSAGLASTYDPDGLHAVLDEVVGGVYGEVERIKGIARSGNGWIRFDVAGGRSTITAFAPLALDEEPRVLAIGRDVDANGLRSAFDACAVGPA